MARKSYDAEAAKQHVKDAQERLAGAVDELITSEGWQRWLKQQSLFHNYSWGNVFLIAAQCPHASHVAGFVRWQELGRQVRKGEKSIRILAPRPWSKVREDETGDEVSVSGISFTTAAIFDVSQTDAIEGRKAFEPAEKPYAHIEKTGDEELSRAVYDALVAHCADKGIPVTSSDEDRYGGAWGAYTPSKNDIWIREAGAASMLGTLIHEVAHAMTYKAVNTVEGYACGEMVVEAVSYIVCDWFGLDALAPSANYVAAWASRDMKSLKKGLQIVQQTAHEIIEVLEGALSAPVQTVMELEVAA